MICGGLDRVQVGIGRGLLSWTSDPGTFIETKVLYLVILRVVATSASHDYPNGIPSFDTKTFLRRTRLRR